MDLNSIVRFIYSNHEIMLGVTITLFLAVTVLVLIRSVMEDRQGSESDISSDAIERTVQKAVAGAVKTAFAEGGHGVGREGAEIGSVVDGEMSPREVVSLKESLLEKESRIESLMKDIESLKASADSGGAADKAKGISDEEFNSLKEKLKELQTKLSEYEIIEDDIADLSMYKEENNKLKTEVDTLKAALETAKNQVQSVSEVMSGSDDQIQAKDAQAEVDRIQKAQEEVTAVNAEVPKESSADTTTDSGKVEISVNTDDNVMSEFAKSLEKGEVAESQERDLISSSDLPIEDPQAAIDALLADNAYQATSREHENVEDVSEIAVDSTKLQVEVEKLAEQMDDAELAISRGEEESSILDEKLDTDRLLAEMSVSEKEPVPAAAAPAPATATVVKPVDDLLAEFEDTEFNNEKESKG